MKKQKKVSRSPYRQKPEVQSNAWYIPVTCFFLSAIAYGYTLLHQETTYAEGHTTMAILMMLLDLAAGSYIIESKLRNNRVENKSINRIPGEQKAIRRQMIFRWIVIVSAAAQFFAHMSSNTISYLSLVVIPAAELIAAYFCLDYFKYETDGKDFPFIPIGISFCVLSYCTFFYHITLDIWSVAIWLAVLGLAIRAVIQGESYLKDAYTLAGIIFCIIVVATANTSMVIGLNHLAVSEEKSVTMTLTDKTYHSRTRYDFESYCFYVTSDDGRYDEEAVEVYAPTYKKYNIGDKVELVERTSIFNVRELKDPFEYER